MKKVLSVVVPSYNMEAYLERNCSACLVGGEEEAWLEVLVVNDGSTDRTGEIAHRFAEAHPGCFRVIDKANGHYGSCVNAGLDAAEGAYIRVVDADDYMETAALRAFLRFLKGLTDAEGEATVDLVLSPFCHVLPDGRVEETFDPRMPVDRELSLAELPSPFATFISLHMITYRTEMLRAMGYRQTTGMPYTDMEWYTLPMRDVRRVRFFPQVLTYYLIGREGQTMEAGTWMRDFPKVLKLTLGLLRNYASDIERVAPEGRQFYREKLLFMLREAYLRTLFGCEGIYPPCSAAEVDGALKELAPDLYDACAGFKRKVCGREFLYVQAFRRGGSDRVLSIRLCRALQAFKLWRRRVRRRLRQRRAGRGA